MSDERDYPKIQSQAPVDTTPEDAKALADKQARDQGMLASSAAPYTSGGGEWSGSAMLGCVYFIVFVAALIGVVYLGIKLFSWLGLIG